MKDLKACEKGCQLLSAVVNSLSTLLCMDLQGDFFGHCYGPAVQAITADAKS